MLKYFFLIHGFGLWVAILAMFIGCVQTPPPTGPMPLAKEWICDSEADELLKAGNLDASIKRHVLFLQNHPAHGLALYHLGYAHGRQGDFKIEAEYYEKAIQAGYQKDGLFFNLGMVYGELREYEKAISAFERGLSVNPKYSDHHFGLGLLYLKRGDPIRAEHFYLKAIELNPSNLDARLLLSEIYVAQGKREKALEQVRQILAVDPEHPDAREYLRQLEGP